MPEFSTNAVKTATKSYLHYARDQAQLVRFQRAIRMTAAPSSSTEIGNSDRDSKAKCACYVRGRAATKQGMA
eukprot:8520785-Pyramimonas_sp.AAC.1